MQSTGIQFNIPYLPNLLNGNEPDQVLLAIGLCWSPCHKARILLTEHNDLLSPQLDPVGKHKTHI